MTDRTHINQFLTPKQQHYIDGIVLWGKLSAENPHMLGATPEQDWKACEQESRRTGKPNRMLAYRIKVNTAMSEHAANNPTKIY